MKHSFIGDLIEGEKYEKFNGDIVTVSSIDTYYAGVYITNRGTGATHFEIMTPEQLRHNIKDFY